MREIKFRIWNGESLEETIIDFNIDKETRHKEFYIYQDDIFMQYTGTKDKNTVEIYEGDIVTHEDFKLPSEVTFERGCFRIHGFTIANFEAIHHMDKIQVIGNIYENPDLLKG